jgi:hypothetical protein
MQLLLHQRSALGASRAPSHVLVPTSANHPAPWRQLEETEHQPVRSARCLPNSATAALGGAAELGACHAAEGFQRPGLDAAARRTVYMATRLAGWLAGWLAATSVSVLWLGRQCVCFLRCAEAHVG